MGTMSLKGWLQPGYRLLVMFFATTLALVTALAWMSWELVRQEGALAGQRMQERRESAAEQLPLYPGSGSSPCPPTPGFFVG